MRAVVLSTRAVMRTRPMVCGWEKMVRATPLRVTVWGGDSTEQVEYLRVFVGQLRKKLEPTASSPRYIVTEPWIGYRFQPGD